MEMCSDILNTGNIITEGRFYYSVEPAEKVYKKVTYCGTVMPNWKDIPSAVKNVDHGEVNYLLFIWKKDGPLMVVSYCLKKEETCFCLHGDPHIFSEAHK